MILTCRQRRSTVSPAAADCGDRTLRTNLNKKLPILFCVVALLATEASARGASFSNGWDLNAWVWLAYTRTDQSDAKSFWDGEFSIDVTKSFDQRAAIS